MGALESSGDARYEPLSVNCQTASASAVTTYSDRQGGRKSHAGIAARFQSMTTPVHLDTQVGGHEGMLAVPDGIVVIKPCLPLEIDFDTTLSSNDALVHLRPHVPKFYGTLTLHGRKDAHGNIGTPDAKDEEAGKRAWRSVRKRRRPSKQACDSQASGCMITRKRAFIKTPKEYGKALTKPELPIGIAKFFPLVTSDLPRGQGLPRVLLQQVLWGLLAELEQIRLAVRSTEMRMVGGSILVIYEGDWDTLNQRLQSSSRDSATDDDADADADAEGDNAEDSEDEDEQGPPYLIKLIDFGHTRLREGEGPDTGVILGLDTTISLFKNRLEQVARTEP